MKNLWFPSSVSIHRTEFQKPRCSNATPHTARKSSLRFPIFVFEHCADEDEVGVRGSQYPLSVIGDIDMRNGRAQPRECSLGLS